MKAIQVEYIPLDKETARQAHMGTSFSPDKRGESEIQIHKEIFEELIAELGDFFEQKHADKLRDLWTAYLHSHASVMSTMITGPANFPFERNQRRGDWADNKRRAIWEYYDNLKKWKGKADRRDAVAAAGGELAMTKAKLESAKAWHETMKAANAILRKAVKTEAGITSETHEKLLALDMMTQKQVDQIAKPNRMTEYKGFGYPSYSLTNSNARIKNTAARVAQLERIEEAKENGVKPDIFEIDGGKVIFDYAENRINVKHDEKPPRSTIDTVKSCGFRWSRNYGHWTRKLTPNAKYAAKLLIKKLTE